MDEGLGPKNVMGRQQAMLFMSGHDGNFPDLHPISVTLLAGKDIPSEGVYTFPAQLLIQSLSTSAHV